MSVFTLEDWHASGKTYTIQDRNWFVREGGEGPCLLLLHGFPTASWGWMKVWHVISTQFRLIAPDFLGSGFSDKPAGFHYSILDLANQVLELLEQLNIRETHILAHAYGVSTAQEILCRSQEEKLSDLEIQSICFIGGGLFPEVCHTTAMQRFLLTAPGRYLSGLFPAPYTMFVKNFSKTFGPAYIPGEAEMQDFWQLLTFKQGHKRVPYVIQYLKERIERSKDWVPAMQQSRVPLGLINGDADPLTGAALNRRWEELLPQFPILRIPEEVGHYPPWEVPERVVELYGHFFENLPSALS